MNPLEEGLALLQQPTPQRPKNPLEEGLEILGMQSAPQPQEPQGNFLERMLQNKWAVEKQLNEAAPNYPGTYLARNLGAGTAEAALDVAALSQRSPIVSVVNPDMLQGLANQVEAGQPNQGTLSRGLRNAVRSGLPMAVVGPAGGSTGAIATGLGITGSQAVTEGRQAGLQGKDLSRYVQGQVFWEGVPTVIFQKIGLGGAESVFGKEAALTFSQGWKPFAKSLTKIFAPEMAEEEIASFGQLMVDQFHGVDKESITPKKMAGVALDTAVATLFMTGGSVAPSITNNLADKLSKSKSASRKDVADALGLKPNELPPSLANQPLREQALMAARNIPSVPPTTQRPPRPEGAAIERVQQTEPRVIPDAGVALPPGTVTPLSNMEWDKKEKKWVPSKKQPYVAPPVPAPMRSTSQANFGNYQQPVTATSVATTPQKLEAAQPGETDIEREQRLKRNAEFVRQEKRSGKNGKRAQYEQFFADIYEGLRLNDYGTGPEYVNTEAYTSKPGLDGNIREVVDKNGWHMRFAKSYKSGLAKTGSEVRISLNVKPSIELIQKLDNIANRYGISYKTPNTSAGWTERNDPITIYVSNPNILTAQGIAQLKSEIASTISPHVRSNIGMSSIGENFANGMTLDNEASLADVQSIIEEAKKISPELGAALESEAFSSARRSGKSNVTSGDMKLSAGQMAAARQLLVQAKSNTTSSGKAISKSATIAPAPQPTPTPLIERNPAKQPTVPQTEIVGAEYQPDAYVQAGLSRGPEQMIERGGQAIGVGEPLPTPRDFLTRERVTFQPDPKESPEQSYKRFLEENDEYYENREAEIKDSVSALKQLQKRAAPPDQIRTLRDTIKDLQYEVSDDAKATLWRNLSRQQPAPYQTRPSASTMERDRVPWSEPPRQLEGPSRLPGGEPFTNPPGRVSAEDAERMRQAQIDEAMRNEQMARQRGESSMWGGINAEGTGAEVVQAGASAGVEGQAVESIRVGDYESQGAVEEVAPEQPQTPAPAPPPVQAPKNKGKKQKKETPNVQEEGRQTPEVLVPETGGVVPPSPVVAPPPVTKAAAMEQAGGIDPARVVAMKKGGKTVRAIAQELGTTQGTISAILEKSNVPVSEAQQATEQALADTEQAPQLEEWEVKRNERVAKENNALSKAWKLGKRQSGSETGRIVTLKQLKNAAGDEVFVSDLLKRDDDDFSVTKGDLKDTFWVFDRRSEQPPPKKGNKRGATDRGQGGGMMIGPIKSPTVYLREAYDAIRKGFVGEQLRKIRPTGQTGSKALKESDVQKQGKIARHIREAGYALIDLDKAFKAEYGTTNVSNEVLDKVRSVLHGGDIKQIPTNLRNAVRNLRNKIDSMSKALIASGAATDELVVKISDNIGTYVTRAYKAHVDPNYDYDTMPEVHRETFRKYIKDSAARANESLTDAEVEGLMKALMNWAKGVEGVTVKNIQGFVQGNSIAKNLGIFMKKDENLPEEFRNFLGEIKDPRAEFIITVSKMASLLEAHNHLQRMKDIGLGTFLFEKPTGDFNVAVSPEKSSIIIVPNQKGTLVSEEGEELPDTEPTTRAVKVPSKMNPWAPLVGKKGKPLYTTAAIARELADTQAVLPWYITEYLRWNSVVKAGFTVGNPIQGYDRNFLSNPGFLIYAGHIPFLRHFSTGWKALRNDLVNNYDTPEIRELNLDLAERGLQDTDPRSNEILMDLPNFFTNDTASGEVEAAFAKAFKYALARYNGMDNIWKKQLYLLEIDRYYKHEFGKHPDSYSQVPKHIKDIAAHRARHEMPNFLYLSKFVKAMRGLPGKGMFVTFPAEVMRITHANFVMAADDIKNGRKEIAAQRIIGMGLTASIPTMLSALSKALFNVDDEEEEAVRDNLATWDQNTTLLFYGRNDKGELLYLDIGFMDPWNYMRDALRALGRGKDWTDSFVKGASEFLSPFLGTESLAGSLLDVWANKKNTGMLGVFQQKTLSSGDIYNEQLPSADKIKAIGQYIWDKNQPGFSRTSRQLVSSAIGNSTHGQKITIPQLIASHVFGTRVRTMDAMNQFGYTVRAFDGEFKKANDIFLSAAASNNKVTEMQLKKAWLNAETARKSLFDEMTKQMNNMRVLGYTDKAIRTQMNASLSEKMVNQVFSGKYVPYQVSPEMWGKIKGIGLDRRDMVRNVMQ